MHWGGERRARDSHKSLPVTAAVPGFQAWFLSYLAKGFTVQCGVIKCGDEGRNYRKTWLQFSTVASEWALPGHTADTVWESRDWCVSCKRRIHVAVMTTYNLLCWGFVSTWAASRSMTSFPTRSSLYGSSASCCQILRFGDFWGGCNQNRLWFVSTDFDALKRKTEKILGSFFVVVF